MKYEGQGELFTHILFVLNGSEYLNINEIVSRLAARLNLTDDFLEQRYEITKQKIFINQIQWKLNDLEKSDLIEFIKKGNKRFFRTSIKGKEFVYSSNKLIRKYINENYYKKISKNKFKPSEIPNIEIPNNDLNEEITPLDQLEQAYSLIKNKTYSDILDMILTKSPKVFEDLVTQLLQKMGYGDGQVTQFSRDGGIDARVKGDVLGFEQIYVQAKCYQQDKTIGRPEIQGFTGALLGLEGNATKGVFITTARFSQEARNFAKNFSKARIVLIDGIQLAKYMYEYELGVQNEKVFYIKNIDNDFWEELDK